MEFGNKLADYLRQGADTLTNLPTEAQRFFTNPQAFTQLITGKNPLPKETGFVAGATGLPAKNPIQGGVLNPASAPYQEGYEQGEPVAIAAMAVPAYAMALRAGAPKAYNALENYMVKSGGMLPLEAYHGTPHKIQGQFDINKVGTGEGAQAYGHGMYFAENPAVAKEYQKMVQGPESTAQHYLKMYKTPESAISALQYGITPNLTAQAKQHSLDAINVLKSGKDIKGNLYKVDIPDTDIPMMLNWDKPLLQQTPQVQEALAKLGIKTDKQKLSQFDDALLDALTNNANKTLPKQPINPTGQDIYQKYVQGNPQLTSQKLNEAGIKGIRYLDEGSRIDFKYRGDPAYTHAGNSFKESGYTPKDALQGMKQAYKNADPKELELAINDVYGIQKKTSNFVVFEPSNVKILEENAKPVARKELIQQQLDKLE